MPKKTREYSINLHFTNDGDHLSDSEHGNWVFRRYCTEYGKDMPSEEGFDFSNDGFTTTPNLKTMRVSKRGSFIMNKVAHDFSLNKEYTFGLRYHIALDTLDSHRKAVQKLCAVKWDDGVISILDKHKMTKSNCISMTLGGTRIEVPAEEVYGTESKICQLVLTVNHDRVTVILNGIKYVDKVISTVPYLFKDLRIGNLQFFNTLEECVVDFDEVVLLNTATYPENVFSIQPYHTLYPEIVEEDETSVNGGNYSYSRPSSLCHMMRDLDITRHVDYKVTLNETSDHKHKFHFDSDDEDDENI